MLKENKMFFCLIADEASCLICVKTLSHIPIVIYGLSFINLQQGKICYEHC